MNKQETAKIINVLMTTYADKETSADVLQMRVAVWQKVFEDIPFDVVWNACMAFIATDKNGRFIPTPGMIRDKVAELADKDGMTADDAWVLVRKAIKRGICFSVQEFEKLPKICQQIVGSPSQLKAWAMSENFNDGVEKSLFVKAYNLKRERKAEMDKLPSSVRAVIAQATPLAGITDGE